MNFILNILLSTLVVLVQLVASDSITSAIREAGYPVEIYAVETKDGFKLKVHRIPHGINKLHYEVSSSNDSSSKETVTNNSSPDKREVVLLVHGLLTSGIFWVVGDRQKLLAYMLADAGYDVWIFNARGTSFSKHVKYDQDDKEFWNYSWHEIGYYDLPAVVDAILIKTGQKKLKYVGHSQGGTTFFVMLTTKPAYNEKISSAFLLAPAVYTHGMSSMVGPLTKVSNRIYEIAQNMGIYAFVPQSAASKIIVDLFCKQIEQTSEMCMNSIFMVVGDGGQIKDKNSFVQFVTKSLADNASMKQVLHFAQLTVSGKFQKFDFGEKNLKQYGVKKPPEYDLSLARVPVTIFYGSEDFLLPAKGMQTLVQKLPNVRNQVDLPWGHLDFVYGEDVDVYINDHIIRSMIAEANNVTYCINLPNGTATLDTGIELETKLDKVNENM